MPTGEDAKELFHRYKNAILERVGREPMDDLQISQIGATEFGRRWAGCVPADRAKKLLGQRDRFAILNTAVTDSAGSHWMGLYLSAAGVPYLYDSFGRNVRHLQWRLSRQARAANLPLRSTDPAPEQHGASALCGQISLSWLLTVRDLGIRATAQAV